MDKLGFLFDPVSKVLIGSVGIQESPLEPGHYLLPPNCTIKQPLPPTNGKDVIFVNDTWSYVDTLSQLPEKPANPINDIRETMVVSVFQGTAALLNAGLLNDVEAFFNSVNATPLQKLAWERVVVFERLSPLVISMGQMLNLTDEQLDQLFIEAAAITI